MSGNKTGNLESEQSNCLRLLGIYDPMIQAIQVHYDGERELAYMLACNCAIVHNCV